MMKTHMLLVIMALIISACASRRDVASTNDYRPFSDQDQHAQMIDGAASRIR